MQSKRMWPEGFVYVVGQRLPQSFESQQKIFLFQQKKLQHVQEDRSRVRRNLSQYQADIQELIRENARKLEALSVGETILIRETEVQLLKEHQALVVRHVAQEQLLLHEHLQEESQHPDGNLLELREKLLVMRGQPSLSEFCKRREGQEAPESTNRQQLLDFWLHVLLEHDQIWKHHLLEYAAKAEGDNSASTVKWNGFLKLKETRWEFVQQEHEALRQSMVARQTAVRSEDGLKSQETETFLKYERDRIEEYLQLQRFGVSRTMKQEILETLMFSSRENKSTLACLKAALMKCWLWMYRERTLLLETLEPLWKQGQKEQDEPEERTSGSSWKGKVQGVSGFYKQMMHECRQLEQFATWISQETFWNIERKCMDCIESLERSFT